MAKGSGGHGSSIERRGVVDVMKGYDLAVLDGAQYFMLWQGSTPKYTYDGDDIDGIGREVLQDMLHASANLGSQATYTLRFYKRLNKNDELDSSTPFYSSFNFKLNDGSAMMPYAAGIGSMDPVMQAIAALNKRLDDMEAGEEEEVVDPKDQLQRVHNFIKEPVIQQTIGFISDLFNKNRHNNNNMFFRSSNQPPANGGGISGVPPENVQDQEQKCMDACNRLAKVDPNIGDNLLKLAALAEKDPNKYQWALNFL